jgi:hypothetical protein
MLRRNLPTEELPAMSLRRISASLVLLLSVGCSGSSTDKAAEPQASAKPAGPVIDINKVEEIEGWVRLKGVKAAEAAKVRAVVEGNDAKVTDGSGGFIVPKADFRMIPDQDAVEVQLGARLKTIAPPASVGPAAYMAETMKARMATECGGQPTVCVAVWQGCGVVACDGGGAVIGACCGGWTGATAPR